MTTATVRDYFKNLWFATALCCVGVLVTGLSFEKSIFSFSNAAALCVGLFYGTSACGSRIKAYHPEQHHDQGKQARIEEEKFGRGTMLGSIFLPRFGHGFIEFFVWGGYQNVQQSSLPSLLQALRQ